jgi:hypothetical protein
MLLACALGVAEYTYYHTQEQQKATLARITAIETSLAASNQQRAQAARSTMLAINKVVRDNGNQAGDVEVLRQAQAIQNRTSAVFDTLHQLRQSWQRADHRAELHQLPAQLNQYLLFIQRFLPDVPTQLASASWLGNFDSAAEPKPAALALLTKLETQVRQLAADALLQQSVKLTHGDGFDKIGALAVPAAATVAPGQLYQAQLVLAAATSRGQMHFSADGRDLPLDPRTGQGVVQFSVPAAQPSQPDTVRGVWHGRVQMAWATTDTLLEVAVPYFIVKPSLR